jgi:hypothetical protein
VPHQEGEPAAVQAFSSFARLRSRRGFAALERIVRRHAAHGRQFLTIFQPEQREQFVVFDLIAHGHGRAGKKALMPGVQAHFHPLQGGKAPKTGGKAQQPEHQQKGRKRGKLRPVCGQSQHEGADDHPARH